jgi:hypothetical protein
MINGGIVLPGMQYHKLILSLKQSGYSVQLGLTGYNKPL